NDRSELQKNSLKYINDPNDTTNKYHAIPKTEKTPIRPLNSIFSDSMENVLSDFEETLNLRENSSELGSRNALNNKRKNIQYNGYFSDYGTTQISNRSLPPRIR
ncbi:unnamed protein product, partial [Onchocerca ochengi]